MKRFLLAICLLAAVPLCSSAQEEQGLIYTDEFLDTVVIRRDAGLNDYAMVGVNYGVTFSRMLFNPPKGQSWKFSRDYCSVMFAKYGKMFGYMPYFGLAFGFAHGYEGFLTAVNKETGSNTFIEYRWGEARFPVTELSYEVVEAPLLAEFHYDMDYLKLIADAGIYGGYRYNVRRNSIYAIPEDMYTDFYAYENKFDYGLQGGLGIAFVFDPLELRLAAGVRYSWSSIYQADYNDEVYYRFAYPFDLMATVGVYVHLGRRRGRTVKDLRKQAYEIVYGTQE